MEPINLNNTGRLKVVVCVINITLFLFLFRIAIPFFKYPFLLLYPIMIVYSIAIHGKVIQKSAKEFFSGYFLIVALILILFISFILSNKIYLMVFKDLINGLVLISIFFMLTLFVTNKGILRFFVDNIAFLLPLFAIIISVTGLLFFFDILTNKDFIINNSITELPLNESFLTDYNFALLPVFFGLICVLDLMVKTTKRLPKVLYSILLIIFSLQIILSGSRRGLIVLIIILIFLAANQLFVIKNKSSYLKALAKESLLFLLLFFFLAFSTFLFIAKAPYYYKNRFLELIGSKNILITKDKIAKRILRYTTIINKSSDYNKIYNILWSPVFNPRDPDSNWGLRIHKTIYPLTGNNVQIVPSGTKGYLMNWSCNPSYYDKFDICESFSLLVNLEAKEGDSVYSSVFCFVSEDFDGSLVELSVGSKGIEESLVSGKLSACYDLDKKGVWQKLDINFVTKKGNVPIYISFFKRGVKDFNKLKGHVIFAYPQYQLTGLKELAFSFLSKQTLCSSYNLSGFFALPFISVFGHDTLLVKDDPVRKWVSKLISEDTTYIGPKSNIVMHAAQNSFTGDRIERLRLAFRLFSKEYDWRQKIFGGGFSFLNWYGYYILNDRTRSDYPHNPFLYILLYSGIFGLSVYLFLLYKVFYYYIKYIKGYPLIFLFFLLTFFFSFFSGGSPLDPPIMGFFVILPFFIHSVYKKDAISIGNPDLKNE